MNEKESKPSLGASLMGSLMTTDADRVRDALEQEEFRADKAEVRVEQLRQDVKMLSSARDKAERYYRSQERNSDELYVKLQEADREILRLKHVLRDVEWQGEQRPIWKDNKGHEQCPACGAVEVEGHRGDCILRAVLT